jgi:DNA-binding LytR/AlgR family response regulator
MSQVRILIVEDEILVAQDFAARLTEAGYDIVGLASSVKEAQDFIDSNKIDIALLDIMLDEGGTGIEVAKYLNTHQPVPFIFISSLVDSQTVEKAKEVSPSAYLVKPFVTRELHIAIEIALNRFEKGGQADTTPMPETTDHVVLPGRVFIKTQSRFERIDLKDILWLEAESNCTTVVTQAKNYLLTVTLSTLHERLNNPLFIRVHRSYVVNADLVDSFDGGRVFINKHEIPVSKQHRDEILRYFKVM